MLPKTGTAQGAPRLGFPFLTACKYWQRIEQTTKRLEKLEYLAKLFIRLRLECEGDMADLLLLAQNIIRVPWSEKPSVLNVGEMTVRRAIQESFNIAASQMKQDLIKQGDLGELVMQYKHKQPKMFGKARPLSVQYVMAEFVRMGDMEGKQAQQQRVDAVRRLLQDASDLECKYLVRLLLGKNRLGIQRKTLLCAVSEYVCYLSLLERRKLPAYDANQDTRVVDYIQACWDKISGYTVTNRLIDGADADADGDGDGDDDACARERGAVPGSLDQVDQFLDGVRAEPVAADGDNPRVLSYKLVGRAFAKVPSMAYLLENAARLQDTQVVPGVPILPMLAKPASSAKDVLDRVEKDFACEWKYDGFRAQVHRVGSKLHVFSRQQENMSQRFPDVLQ